MSDTASDRQAIIEGRTALGLELGSIAVAVVKSTTVIIETPRGES